MNKQEFINILDNPNQIELNTIGELRGVINKYPYFQSARVLYLKGLKNKESFKYNNELKVTSAYTTDRTVLFDFITSNIFNESKVLSEEKVVRETKNELKIGEPLAFGKGEKHSFNQWLQLTSTCFVEKKSVTKDNTNIQNDIIERFIATNPKISKVDKNTEIKPIEIKEEPLLMTETLARVYLEQKKYDNAIKAYEILSLKYPKKSVFFANRIEEIKIIQKNK
ncbi:MAG: hypothetical protein KGV59_05610 [Tenacibaculum sp.]|nr:hypothetical protein [Tenacibaculum sp.]